MTFEQLAGLIKAGYTEEQIRNIGTIMGTGTGTNTGTDTGTGTGTDTHTPTPTTTATPTPTDKPMDKSADKNGGTLSSAAQYPGESTEQKAESETVTLLKEMLGLIQRGNINTMGTGTMQEQTGADVLAEILNPSPKTK